MVFQRINGGLYLKNGQVILLSESSLKIVAYSLNISFYSTVIMIGVGDKQAVHRMGHKGVFSNETTQGIDLVTSVSPHKCMDSVRHYPYLDLGVGLDAGIVPG